jgi:hypothetical protein
MVRLNTIYKEMIRSKNWLEMLRGIKIFPKILESDLHRLELIGAFRNIESLYTTLLPLMWISTHLFKNGMQ